MCPTGAWHCKSWLILNHDVGLQTKVKHVFHGLNFLFSFFASLRLSATLFRFFLFLCLCHCPCLCLSFFLCLFLSFCLSCLSSLCLSVSLCLQVFLCLTVSGVSACAISVFCLYLSVFVSVPLSLPSSVTLPCLIILLTCSTFWTC